MNLIYLTTHIYDRDFDGYYGKGIVMPNPAGQNYHGKLIRSLVQKDDVSVYSLPPAVFGITKTKKFPSPEGVSYTYLGTSQNRYLRALFAPKALSKLIVKEHKGRGNTIVLYDSLNLTLGKVAKAVAKKLNAKRIAILTDGIHNITGVSPSYQNRIMRLVSSSNASIALTRGLVDTYRLTNKPSYVQPILVEEEEITPKKLKRPYIYYGGALFEKDGTKDLLEAYLSTEPNLDLVISGHGQMELEVAKAAKEHKRITYLGQISKGEHYSYIAGASICINPRRYNKALDDNAVPSKVMEYLTYGKAVASTLSTPIKDKYPKDITWIEGDLTDFFKAHLDEQGKLIRLKKNTASNKDLTEFGIKKTGQNLHRFLASLI